MPRGTPIVLHSAAIANRDGNLSLFLPISAEPYDSEYRIYYIQHSQRLLHHTTTSLHEISLDKYVHSMLGQYHILPPRRKPPFSPRPVHKRRPVDTRGAQADLVRHKTTKQCYPNLPLKHHNQGCSCDQYTVTALTNPFLNTSNTRPGNPYSVVVESSLPSNFLPPAPALEPGFCRSLSSHPPSNSQLDPGLSPQPLLRTIPRCCCLASSSEA